MAFVIAQPCVDVMDRSCIDACPVDCIYEGERSLYIHPDECIDCGACDPVCPVEAIYHTDDVPDQWAEYTRANVEFFELAAGDPPFIAGLAPQNQPAKEPSPWSISV
jgi:NAD-dependent dihydropyrimidine dehydrogenase PreA subunit